MKQKSFYILLCFIILFSSKKVYGQTFMITRSVCSNSGGSYEINSFNSEILVLQTIGQKANIGRVQNGQIILRQGFLQPIKSSLINNNSEKNELQTLVYPIPFKNNLNINFLENIKSNIYIKINDLTGILVYQNSFPSSQVLNLDLKQIPEGLYILNISDTKKTISLKIIKQDQ